MWPLLASVTLPLSVVTLGMAGLVLNGALVALAAKAALGRRSLGAGVVLAFGLAALTAVLSALLAIDDDEAWQRNVVRRQARRRGERTASDVPGVVFLQIDGLAHEVLQALRDGHVPTLARWLRAGTHRLVRWETDWSSQTGACQAGLLHGDNDDMPAFRWWRRSAARRSSRTTLGDAAELERRRSDGRPAARRRRKQGEHPVGRRDALHAHHEHGAAAPAPDRPRLQRLLRAPLRRRAHLRPGAGGHRSRAPRGRPPAAG